MVSVFTQGGGGVGHSESQETPGFRYYLTPTPTTLKKRQIIHERTHSGTTSATSNAALNFPLVPGKGIHRSDSGREDALFSQRADLQRFSRVQLHPPAHECRSQSDGKVAILFRGSSFSGPDKSTLPAEE